jgi:glycosyltransferase involved in cell wall biosynthesis
MIPHVMQVVHALCPGGSEMLASAIATAGVAQGTRMSICALHQGGALEAVLHPAGVTTHALARRPGFQPRVLARLYRLFRRERVSVVITHHLGQLFYSAIGARLAGSRLLHVEHEFYTLASVKAKRRLRIAARLAERVVGVSEEIAEFLVREVGLPPAKVMVIRNGVDVERFAPPTGRERAALGVPPGVPVLGTVGRLDRVKDHGTLLAAFRLVLEAFPTAMLVIIGDGETRSELEASVKLHGFGRNVKFLGERFDVAALLPGIDVFVLSSIHEGLSLALLEAMACARPVVITDVGAAATAVRDSRTGLLVPPKDPDALAAAVTGLLRDKRRATEMGVTARRTVEERYKLRDTVSAYLSLCRGVMRDKLRS